MTFIVDGTNGLTFPNSTTQASAGSVLQVVNAAYSTYTTSSSNVYANTGLSATITPKFSTSKILCIVDMVSCTKESGTGSGLFFQLLRGATSIIVFEKIGAFNGVAQYNSVGTCGCNYLDSPATTSSTTYSIQFSNGGGGALVSFNNYLATPAPTSTMTIMEIAG